MVRHRSIRFFRGDRVHLYERFEHVWLRMIDETESAVVHWLLTPTAYPYVIDRVDLVETHISYVFLAGQFAFKLKKPVKYDFLDFSTVAKREHACHEEVRLNRRLAPIYLGVVPITRELDGGLQLNGNGTIIDWLVQMRRLPINDTLDKLLSRGELHTEEIDQLANVLAAFYRSLKPLAVTPQEYRDRFTNHVCGNSSELLMVSHHCPADAVRRVHGFQLQLLHLKPELFDDRVRSGRIIEGHGDLRQSIFALPIQLSFSIALNSTSTFGAST